MRQATGRLDRKKTDLYLAAGLLLAAMALHALLNSYITLYSDDYWYGTFYNQGFRGFLKNMADHYLHTNGRFYVHLIVPTVLLFGTKLFTFLSPVLLALLYWLGAKMTNDRLPPEGALFSAALGVLATMAFDVQYLRMTLLWISAYFNYVFPVLMTAAAAYFQKRWYDGRQSKAGHVLGLVLAVLAGASTEQCALVTLVVLWGFAILSRAFARTPRKIAWGYPLFALAGFLTILLAPGSWARVGRGVDGGILSCLHPTVFLARFFDAMIYVVKYPSTVLLLAAAGVLTGLQPAFDRTLPKTMALGYLAAAGQLLFWALGLEKAACVWAALSLLGLAALLLLRREFWMTGLLVLGSLASHMMLIITTLGSERTAFIGIVALLVAAVSLLMRLFYRETRDGMPIPSTPEGQRRSRAARLATVFVLSAAFVCAYVPTLRGYMASKKIVDENLRSVEKSRTTGVCYYNIDIDPRYRFTMPFEGTYFYNNFRACYRIPDSTKLVFTSTKWKLADLSSGSDTCVFPTLEDGRGVWFPVDYAVQAAGGTAEYSWKNHSYTITLGSLTYLAEEDGRLWLYQQDGSKKQIADDFTILPPFSETYTLLYCPADKLRDYLGVEWTYDKTQNLYTVEGADDE